MRKWLWIALLAMLILVGLAINIYLNALEPKRTAEEKATAIALEETEITNVHSIELYYGSSAYYVVEGTNKEKEDIIAWIPENGDKIMVANAKDGITEKEAINILYKNVSPAEIIEVRLGIEKKLPLWEIYYRTSNDKINYYYIDFETGEEVRKIQNL